MAQKPRNCTTVTNLDKKFNSNVCPRLLKRDKKLVNAQKIGRNLKSSTATLAVPNSNNYVHKEVISDNAALVEVTVWTQPTRKPPDRNREPWNKLLLKNADNQSSFGSFDPLRTLHFLSKELQAKLRTLTPNNTKVMDIISDMQEILNRVPPEVFSPVYTFEPLEKLKRRVEEKGCQTINSSQSSPESEILQRHLEASTIKLEVSCKKMEVLCFQLKKEKEMMEHQLNTEKDTVCFLRKQIDELQLEKIKSTNVIFKKLYEEKEHLQTQVKQLQEQLDLNSGLTMANLKACIQELQEEKSTVNQEVVNLRHELILHSMEKEKYIAILKVRDRQIDEIQGEIGLLQTVINEQLKEIQPQLSAASSQTSITDSDSLIHWQKIVKHDNKDDEREIGDMGLNIVDISPLTQLFTNCHNLQSGDSKDIYKGDCKVADTHEIGIVETPKLKTDHSDMSNICNLLSTLKTHALIVTVPQLPFDKDI